MGRTQAAIKRLLLGREMATRELEHTLLPKALALPVFSSDPLSSNAYATQEILLVLAVAGAGALQHVIPISLAVAILLATVVVSYRQTVRAYPSGGGAYRVSHENLGTYAGLLAASALLLDYVLTVSVSITAGVDAIVSASTGLAPLRIQLALAFVALVTLANLRGTRESGLLFATPTYGFVLSIYLLLITGFIKCIGGCPQAESAHLHLETSSELAPFLILKAFAAGTTALTGVEAISDGVPAFRYPQSKNAATTLALMGALSVSMFLGISWLANHTDVVYTEESERTVVAQVAHAVFGGGPFFYVVQVMTAGILILAANTAYQDFPRLSSILARDRFMPHQFMNRGDRLVFSNGIIALALLASLLIVVFDANLNKLIQLYLVGVFISFTLSQTGMVLRLRRRREAGWKRKSLVSGFGAVVTGIVFVVIVTTKFQGGAWIIVAAIPVLIYLMRAVKRHYDKVAEELARPERRPSDRRPAHQHMLILAQDIDAATARAIGYARSVRAGEVSAVTFDVANAAPWKRLAPDIPLDVAPLDDSFTPSLKRYLREKRNEFSSDDFLSVIFPEVLPSRGLFEIARRPGMHLVKASLLMEPDVQVVSVPIVKQEIDPAVDETHEPGRHYVLVLVASVHNATLQALEYAETFRPTELRGVNFGLDPEASEELGNEWLAAGIPHPLEIEDSPFRDIGRSLGGYIRRNFRPDGVHRTVTVVIPEFVVKTRRHQILHGQTALVVKRHLLFERGVAVASVPYPLER